MKKIGLVSDLHLEGSNIKLINPGWDYLVIAGDLSADLDSMQHFFAYHAPQDIPIIYVLGNHEFEGRSVEDTPNKIRELLNPFENVFLLDNESVIIDDIKFIGSTLWSNFESDGLTNKKEVMNWAKTNIVDFRKIKYQDEKGNYNLLTPEKMLALHQEAYSFINFELKKNYYDGPTVVVTHFAPHLKSLHPSKEKMMSSYWVNNLEELMGFSDFWFHGHTHNSFDYKVNNTNVICNPRGYSKICDINQNISFNKELIIPVDYLKEDIILTENVKNIVTMKKI